MKQTRKATKAISSYPLLGSGQRILTQEFGNWDAKKILDKTGIASCGHKCAS